MKMKKLFWIVACCLLGAASLSVDHPASAAPQVPSASTKKSATNSAATNSAAATPSSQAEGGIVNLNEATAEELALLPGVGPSRANAIVAHRKAHPFKRLEELMRVKGIGKKTFARLRPLLSLSGPTTLKERPRRS